MHVYGEISGRLSTEGQLSGRLAADGQLSGELTIPAQILPPEYEGAYTFTPTEETQTAATADLMMTDDITIEPIPEEYIIPTGSVSISHNGTHDVTEYAEAVVDVQPELQTKEVTIDSAGTETVTPGSGYYGLSEVEITVPGAEFNFVVPQHGAFDIDINENGLIAAAYQAMENVEIVAVSGFAAAGATAGIYVDQGDTLQLPVQAGATVTPSESQQVAVPKGKWTTGAVLVDPIPVEYMIFIVNLSYNSTTQKWTPAETYAEISAAKAAGKTIVVRTDSTYGGECSAEGAFRGTDFIYWTRAWLQGTITETEYTFTSGGLSITDGPYLYNDTSGASLNSSAQMLNGVSAYAGGVKYTGDIPTKTLSDLTASGAVVTVPSGYYASQVTKSVAAGTAGTPVATKGAVSNHAIAITPSVTNVTGYITGGTKTGTAVSVTASELVSGTYTVDSSGTKDVTNYASVDVPSGTEGSTYANIYYDGQFADIDIAVRLDGGWFDTDYYGGILSYSAVPANTTITPTESQQTVGGPDYLMEDVVTIAAIPSSYVGSGITRRDSTHLSASGATISVPAGYYENNASKAVASGTEGTPTASKGAVNNHAITVTPQVTNAAGYISGGTHSGTGVSVSASELVSGTKSITANGTGIDVTNYAQVDVAVPSGSPSLQTKSKTYTPTTSQQSETISPDAGYDGLSAVNVTVNAIPGEYIIPTGNKAITAAGNNIDVAAYATVSVAAGSAGTPTATKGTVSNHAIQITPSVVNTAGYITGGTKTGTAVTVQASELVSGSETKTANGTYDVTNLAELIVNVSGGGGSSNWTLLGTKDCGTISTSSTTAATINKDFTVSDVGDYDLLVVETSVNTKTNGRHAATARLIWLTAGSAIGTKNGATIATATWNVKLSSNGTATSRASTTPRGVYPYSCTLSTSGGVTSAAIVMYSCYNSTQTGTINGAYTARVYGVKLYDLIGG